MRKFKIPLIIVLIVFIAAACTFCLALLRREKATPPADIPVNDASFDNTVLPYDRQKADYTLDIDSREIVHPVSDMLFGVFFEDINFAADGGLYAEMIANRSFEFTDIAENGNLFHWNTVGQAVAKVNTEDKEGCLNENNPSYLVLKNPSDEPAGIENIGFLDGIKVEKGKNYNVSVYLKSGSYRDKVTVSLMQADEVLASGTTDLISTEWAEHTLKLKCLKTADKDVTLRLTIGSGEICADMISLFPEDTFKGRKNGLRKDLCEYLDNLHPKFIRFPGGCVIEGEDKKTQYSWKDSVGTGKDGLPLEFDGKQGDVAARKQGENIWTDHAANSDPYPSFMTYGLGFYEYFLLAEDLGAVGVPVINSGLYCQMRGKGGVDINSDEFRQSVQDMLDLVEFCRGDGDSVWGGLRTKMGHAEPFELKYICIGNENEGEDYYTRYSAFLDAFKRAAKSNPVLYDGIELIYSAGASDATHGANYIKSYEYAKKQLGKSDDISAFAGATDQHYYNSPQWFLRNTDYYDEANYSRSADKMTDTRYGGAIPVFVGEYAARSNTLEAALAEAAYMTAFERNGDIVRMAAYAPLFSSTAAHHWTPDLIWFSGNKVTGSVNYYAQKLFMNNSGTALIKSGLSGAEIKNENLSGRVGVGVWYTKAKFDNLQIIDEETGEIIGGEKFTTALNFLLNWEKTSEDKKFKVKKGALIHDDTWMSDTLIGGVTYLNKEITAEKYTYTLEATKLDGAEGFIIPFAVKDRDNNYFWNIGGWTNTVSCLQQVENGEKTDKIPGTVRDFTAETNKAYNLKICVDGTKVRCFIDGELYVDYDTDIQNRYEAYQSVTKDENGDLILKIVNVTPLSKTTAISVDGFDYAENAKVSQLAGTAPEDENIPGEKEKFTDIKFEIGTSGGSFNYRLPAYSITVIRFPAK
ncbi:MAG: carbohydrate binding domain-containing protein [Clostridia bacterium]|nr:carbohydrate binding domain-containing protein [Clostridia bacterium]